MRTVRSILLALVLTAALTVSGPAKEKAPPPRGVTAYAAVDGIVVASQSKEFPFTLRIVGADAKKMITSEGQFLIPTDDRLFQVTIARVADVLPSATRQPADREVLAAHAAWECKEHNEKLHFQQTATPEFLEGHGRTWAHWTYDLSALTEALKKDPKQNLQGPLAKTQRVLTTVVGKHIIVLVGTTMSDQDEDGTMTGLFKAAKTFVVHPKPLSPQQIKDLCSQEQP